MSYFKGWLRKETAVNGKTQVGEEPTIISSVNKSTTETYGLFNWDGNPFWTFKSILIAMIDDDGKHSYSGVKLWNEREIMGTFLC